MVLSVTKCFVMHFPASIKKPVQQSPSVTSNGATAKIVDKARILGITFTSSLNWTIRANSVRSELSSLTVVIQRFVCSLDGLTRQKIVRALIMPKIFYCLPVWGNMPLTNCAAFDNTLLRCVKIIIRRTNAKLDRIAYGDTGIMPFRSLELVRNTKALLNIIGNNELHLYPHAKAYSDVSALSTRQCVRRKIKLKDFKRTSDRYCFAYGSASG